VDVIGLIYAGEKAFFIILWWLTTTSTVCSYLLEMTPREQICHHPQELVVDQRSRKATGLLAIVCGRPAYRSQQRSLYLKPYQKKIPFLVVTPASAREEEVSVNISDHFPVSRCQGSNKRGPLT